MSSRSTGVFKYIKRAKKRPQYYGRFIRLYRSDIFWRNRPLRYAIARAGRRENLLMRWLHDSARRLFDSWSAEQRRKELAKKIIRGSIKRKAVRKPRTPKIRSSMKLSRERFSKKKRKPKTKAQKPIPLYRTKIPTPTIKGGGFYRKLEDSYPYQMSGKKRLRRIKSRYPFPLGVDKIFDITLTSVGKYYLRRDEQLKKVVIEAMNYIHILLMNEAYDLIYKFVPADVGMDKTTNKPNLRKSLMDSLNEGSVFPNKSDRSLARVGMHIRWYSKMEYAGIANQMPNKSLRHPQKADKRYKYPVRNKSWKTGKQLEDPYATKSFFQIIRNKLKKYTRNTLIPKFYERIHSRATFVVELRKIIKDEESRISGRAATGYGDPRLLIKQFEQQIKFWKGEVKAMFRITGLGAGRF